MYNNSQTYLNNTGPQYVYQSVIPQNHTTMPWVTSKCTSSEFSASNVQQHLSYRPNSSPQHKMNNCSIFATHKSYHLKWKMPGNNYICEHELTIHTQTKCMQFHNYTTEYSGGGGLDCSIPPKEIKLPQTWAIRYQYWYPQNITLSYYNKTKLGDKK